MTTLLIFMFETGDSSCQYWNEPVVVYEPYAPGKIETKARIYMDDNPESGYDEAVEYVMNDAGIRWEWVAGKIPECDRLDILIV